MAYDTTTTVTDDLTDNLASYHNQLKTAIDHLMSTSAYGAYVNAASMTGNVTLTDSDFPIQSFSPTAARDLTLPTVASTNHAFYVINRSSLYNITVKNSGGTEIGIVAPGMFGIYLSDGSNAYYTGQFGGELNNHIVNGGGDYFQVVDPTASTSLTDGGYNASDMFYSLIQGSGATEKRGSAIGTSKYSIRLTAGGTTNRYGKAQIRDATDSISMRGKTIIGQLRIKPTNNAGSGSRDYRIALLSWSGTADAPTKDVVNDWTSSTYTTGNFFASTSLSLIGTASTTIAHGSESVLSVSGSVPTGCNNLIMFFWVEDVPTHASDYAEFGEIGVYVSNTVQDWKPRPEAVELALCQQRCYKSYEKDTAPGSATSVGAAAMFNDAVSQTVGYVGFKVTMRATPTFTVYSNVTGTSGKIRSNGADVTATSVQGGTNGVFSIYATLTANITSTFQLLATAYLGV